MRFSIYKNLYKRIFVCKEMAYSYCLIPLCMYNEKSGV